MNTYNLANVSVMFKLRHLSNVNELGMNSVTIFIWLSASGAYYIFGLWEWTLIWSGHLLEAGCMLNFYNFHQLVSSKSILHPNIKKLIKGEVVPKQNFTCSLNVSLKYYETLVFGELSRCHLGQSANSLLLLWCTSVFWGVEPGVGSYSRLGAINFSYLRWVLIWGGCLIFKVGRLIE